MQDPAASIDALDPETVQIEVVLEVKVTGSPELAVAERASVLPTFAVVAGTKLIVCWTRPTAK
jgi:hypothetical protein